MALKDFRTRRSLLAELENRIETIDRRNKTIKKLTAECDTLNSSRNLWKQKAKTNEEVINELTLENEKLRKRLKAYETLESDTANFECVGVTNVN